MSNSVRAFIGVDVSDVLPPLAGVWMGVAFGVHIASTTSVPDPLWLGILTGATGFTMLIGAVTVATLGVVHHYVGVADE